MISATEYREKKEKLMQEYEAAVRKWLKDNGKDELSEKIPFYRDGVTCPEVWFKENNNFRPLFILKEVSTGKNTIAELDDYLEVWGHKTCFEFAEDPFDDIKYGYFTTWQRIARLAKGLEEMYLSSTFCDYYKHDFSFVDGGLEYLGNNNGYRINHPCQTANTTYNEIINKIAVIDIKKVGGGTKTNSELSTKGSVYYTSHIESPLDDLFIRQIKLINPTVIICCGREGGGFSTGILKEIKEKCNDIPWIDGYHPTYSSNENFYEIPIETYKKILGK